MDATEEGAINAGQVHEAHAKAPLMRKVVDIPEAIYGVRKPVEISFEPSHEDIKMSLDSDQLEERGYQSHLDDLEAEWNRECKGNLEEFARLQKLYHARRIAYFVKNGWKDFPIEVMENGDMRDGTHRLKAAKFMKLQEVEITIHHPTSH